MESVIGLERESRNCFLKDFLAFRILHVTLVLRTRYLSTTVFSKHLNACSRLIRCIKLAQVAPGFDAHGFATTAEYITKTINEHIRSEAGDFAEQTK